MSVYILTLVLLVVLIINVDTNLSDVFSQYDVIVKIPSRNHVLLIDRFIKKVGPDCRKCCFRGPNFKNFPGGGVGGPDLPNMAAGLVNRSR